MRLAGCTSGGCFCACHSAKRTARGFKNLERAHDALRIAGADARGGERIAAGKLGDAAPQWAFPRRLRKRSRMDSGISGMSDSPSVSALK